MSHPQDQQQQQQSFQYSPTQQQMAMSQQVPPPDDVAVANQHHQQAQQQAAAAFGYPHQQQQQMMQQKHHLHAYYYGMPAANDQQALGQAHHHQQQQQHAMMQWQHQQQMAAMYAQQQQHQIYQQQQQFYQQHQNSSAAVAMGANANAGVAEPVVDPGAQLAAEARRGALGTTEACGDGHVAPTRRGRSEGRKALYAAGRRLSASDFDSDSSEAVTTKTSGTSSTMASSCGGGGGGGSSPSTADGRLDGLFSFETSLLDMLNAEDPPVLSWLPPGHPSYPAFVVHRRDEFARRVLPGHNLPLHELHLHGFRFVNEGQGAGFYRHDLFRRDDPDLRLALESGCRQVNGVGRVGADGAVPADATTKMSDASASSSGGRGSSPSTADGNSGSGAFPSKLLEILNKEDPAVVSWLPSGLGFAVHRPDVFARWVLPQYFRHRNMTRFQRQLNMHGFRCIDDGPEADAYRHERNLFRRDDRDLCLTVQQSCQVKDEGGGGGGSGSGSGDDRDHPTATTGRTATAVSHEHATSSGSDRSTFPSDSDGNRAVRLSPFSSASQDDHALASVVDDLYREMFGGDPPQKDLKDLTLPSFLRSLEDRLRWIFGGGGRGEEDNGGREKRPPPPLLTESESRLVQERLRRLVEGTKTTAPSGAAARSLEAGGHPHSSIQRAPINIDDDNHCDGEVGRGAGAGAGADGDDLPPSEYHPSPAKLNNSKRRTMERGEMTSKADRTTGENKGGDDAIPVTRSEAAVAGRAMTAASTEDEATTMTTIADRIRVGRGTMRTAQTKTAASSGAGDRATEARSRGMGVPSRDDHGGVDVDGGAGADAGAGENGDEMPPSEHPPSPPKLGNSKRRTVETGETASKAYWTAGGEEEGHDASPVTHSEQMVGGRAIVAATTCSTCTDCLDIVKFGGPCRRKQACITGKRVLSGKQKADDSAPALAATTVITTRKRKAMGQEGQTCKSSGLPEGTPAVAVAANTESQAVAPAQSPQDRKGDSDGKGQSEHRWRSDPKRARGDDDDDSGRRLDPDSTSHVLDVIDDGGGGDDDDGSSAGGPAEEGTVTFRFDPFIPLGILTTASDTVGEELVLAPSSEVVGGGSTTATKIATANIRPPRWIVSRVVPEKQGERLGFRVGHVIRRIGPSGELTTANSIAEAITRAQETLVAEDSGASASALSEVVVSSDLLGLLVGEALDEEGVGSGDEVAVEVTTKAKMTTERHEGGDDIILETRCGRAPVGGQAATADSTEAEATTTTTTIADRIRVGRRETPKIWTDADAQRQWRQGHIEGESRYEGTQRLNRERMLELKKLREEREKKRNRTEEDEDDDELLRNHRRCPEDLVDVPIAPPGEAQPRGGDQDGDDHVKEPHPHDVLLIRSGDGTLRLLLREGKILKDNSHRNKCFRSIVKQIGASHRDVIHVTENDAAKGESSPSANDVVVGKVLAAVRGLDPPGRFLERARQGCWIRLSEAGAREVTSCALLLACTKERAKEAVGTSWTMVDERKMDEVEVAFDADKNCGKCINCLDMVKFGGPGKRRQACIIRKQFLSRKEKADGSALALAATTVITPRERKAMGQEGHTCKSSGLPKGAPLVAVDATSGSRAVAPAPAPQDREGDSNGDGQSDQRKENAPRRPRGDDDDAVGRRGDTDSSSYVAGSHEKNGVGYGDEVVAATAETGRSESISSRWAVVPRLDRRRGVVEAERLPLEEVRAAVYSRVRRLCDQFCLLPPEPPLLERRKRVGRAAGAAPSEGCTDEGDEWAAIVDVTDVCHLVFAALHLESLQAVPPRPPSPHGEHDDHFIGGDALRAKLSGPQPWMVTRKFVVEKVADMLEATTEDGVVGLDRDVDKDQRALWGHWLLPSSSSPTSYGGSVTRRVVLEKRCVPIIEQFLRSWRPDLEGKHDRCTRILLSNYVEQIWKSFVVDWLGKPAYDDSTKGRSQEDRKLCRRVSAIRHLNEAYVHAKATHLESSGLCPKLPAPRTTSSAGPSPVQTAAIPEKDLLARIQSHLEEVMCDTLPFMPRSELGIVARDVLDRLQSAAQLQLTEANISSMSVRDVLDDLEEECDYLSKRNCPTHICVKMSLVCLTSCDSDTVSSSDCSVECVDPVQPLKLDRKRPATLDKVQDGAGSSGAGGSTGHGNAEYTRISTMKSVGARVYAKFSDGDFYWGRIEDISCMKMSGEQGKKTFSVVFEDGDTLSGIDDEDICTEYDYVKFLGELPRPQMSLPSNGGEVTSEARSKVAPTRTSMEASAGGISSFSLDLVDTRLTLDELHTYRCKECTNCKANDCGRCYSCCRNNSGENGSARKVCLQKMCCQIEDYRKAQPADLGGFPSGWTFVFNGPSGRKNVERGNPSKDAMDLLRVFTPNNKCRAYKLESVMKWKMFDEKLKAKFLQHVGIDFGDVVSCEDGAVQTAPQTESNVAGDTPSLTSGSSVGSGSSVEPYTLAELHKHRCKNCVLCKMKDCGHCYSCCRNESGENGNDKQVCLRKMCCKIDQHRKAQSAALGGFPPGWTFIFYAPTNKNFRCVDGGHVGLNGLRIFSPDGIKFRLETAALCRVIDERAKRSFLKHVGIVLVQEQAESHFLVGKGYRHEWTDAYGTTKVIYGRIVSRSAYWEDGAKKEYFDVEYSDESISLLGEFAANGLEVPKTRVLPCDVAWGGWVSFDRAEQRCSNRNTVSLDHLSPCQCWVAPDMRKEEMVMDTISGQRLPRLTLVFRGCKLMFSVKKSTIPNAGYGLFVKWTSLKNGGDGTGELTMEAGELLDIGVYAPFRKEDKKHECVLRVKNYIHSLACQVWSFKAADDTDHLYDITDEVTGELHGMAKQHVPTYVNECDPGEIPTIYAWFDPEGSVHYLFGIDYDGNLERYNEGMANLRRKLLEGEFEVFVNYGAAYEEVRRRKGYSTSIIGTERLSQIKANAEGDALELFEEIHSYDLNEISMCLHYFKTTFLSDFRAKPAGKKLKKEVEDRVFDVLERIQNRLNEFTEDSSPDEEGSSDRCVRKMRKECKRILEGYGKILKSSS